MKKQYKMTNKRKLKMIAAMNFPAEITEECQYEKLASVTVIATNNDFVNATFDNTNNDAYDVAVEYVFCKALKWYLTRKARW